MGSSTQQTQSQTVSQPWSVQEPYLENAFSGAQSAMGSANANASSSLYGTPTQLTAGATPGGLQTYQSAIDYGLGGTQGTAATNAGTAALGQGGAATSGALSGLAGYNPAANLNTQGAINAGNAYAAGANIPAQVQAAMTGANQEASEVTLPGLQRSAAATGNANSSTLGNNVGLVQSNLAEQAAGLGSQLQAQYYNQGASNYMNMGESNNTNALNALSTEGSLGNSATNTGLSGLSSGVGNQENLYTMAAQGAAGQQAANQATDTNQSQMYSLGQQSPYTALDNYYNIIGSGQWGGTSDTNSTTTATPSLASTLGGLLGAGASLFGGNGILGQNSALSTGGILNGW